MNSLILTIIYIWFGLKILYIKTYGNLLFEIIILLLSISLIFGGIIAKYNNDSKYFFIPIIPYLFFIYYEHKISIQIVHLLHKKLN